VNCIDIGWCISEERSSSIFFPPCSASFNSRSNTNKNKDGVSSCPAVHSAGQRLFFIKSPYSIRLRAQKIGEKKLNIFPIYPETEIKEEIITSLITIEPRENWIEEETPVIQIKMPYVFFSDSSAWISQLETTSRKKNKNWSLIQGRFDIYNWQRPLSFAFQWIDNEQDILIKRGDPIFQLMFDSDQACNNFNLSKVELHEKLIRRIDSCAGVTSLIRNTSQIINNNRDKNLKLIQ